jgi:uncharacterized protein YbaR (Trm112 family)
VFIELVEYLRCPATHDETYLVLVLEEIIGRDVRRGSVGCPVCRAEYPVVDGIAEFGGDEWCDAATDPGDPLPDPEVVHALLGLASPGGYVVLVGSATRLARQLGELLGGVHFVGVNPPPDVEASPLLSPLRATRLIPLRTSSVRGVVVGAEHARSPWLEQGMRVLLNRQRLVVLREVDEVPGTERLAASQGLWVGEKREATYSS